MGLKKPIKFIFSLIFIIVIGLSMGLYFLKTYNPTADNWQKDLVTNLAKLTDIFYLPHQLKTHQLPVYYLYIDPQDYLTLNQNLPDPKKTAGVLPDEFKIYVPAQLKFKDQTFDIKVRYRGYDFDHWTRDKKSFKIKFNQLNSSFNQSEINLIIPEDRGLYLESLSNFRAKRMGLTVPDSQFINLVVNDNNHGVYWQVESLNEHFLVKNNLPVSQIYKDTDQPNTQAKKSIYTSVDYWEKSIDQGSDTDNSQLSVLLNLLNQPDDLLFFQKLPEILDLDNFLTWQAHSVLMGSAHQDTYHNIRFYYHPEDKKFMVIPWDVLGALQWPKDYNPLVTRVLSNPDWLGKRNLILSGYLDNPDHLKSELEYYDQLFLDTKIAFFQDTQKYFSNYGYAKQVKRTRQQLVNQVNLVKSNL